VTSQLESCRPILPTARLASSASSVKRKVLANLNRSIIGAISGI
jgi:hypothetical protein